ncbi:uncharacterized protein LOC21392493 [Morus notabilis]|nr:uncharacterized protein LOC21392493 [Morus notabilis]
METLSESALMSLLAKEARAKARARARARTKEKKHNYCTSSYNSNKIRSNYNMGKCAGWSSQISNQLFRTVTSHLDQDQTLRSPNLVGEISQEKEAGLFRMRSNARKDDDDDDQEEPSVVMIKRNKLKFPLISSGTYDHHQGQFCGISKGESSNSAMIYSSPSLLLTQNWDNNNSNNISTASPHSSSFCLPT